MKSRAYHAGMAAIRRITPDATPRQQALELNELLRMLRIRRELDTDIPCTNPTIH